MRQRPETADHQKKVPPQEWREVRIPVIRFGARFVTCSCGWSYHHARQKPREAAADRHVNRRHGGQAMFL